MIEGLKLHKTFNKNDNLLIKVIKFHRAIRKLRPDVIIQHGLTIFSSLLAVYCRGFRIKFVYMFASDVEADGYYQSTCKRALLFKLLIRYADVLVTQNNQQYYKILKKYRKKTKILFNGFPIKKLSNITRDYVLWVGRAEKLKNPLKFIESATFNSNYKIVMICTKVVGQEKYFNEIKHFADEIKNLNFIPFVPFSEIEIYFRSAKILVNTSDYEGFPQTFIQAAINKVPIISLNVNPDNFITKHKCGIVCDGNEAFMNQSIQNLLSDSQQLNQLSNNAYNYARENHDIKKNTKMLYDLIFKR